MKKFLLIAAALALFISPSTALAQMPYSGEIINQQHNYEVHMRSDGKSVVKAGLVFVNTDNNSDKTTYQFTAPEGVKLNNVKVRQVMARHTQSQAQDQSCITYETFGQWRESQPNVNSRFYDTNKQCLEYEQVETPIYDEDYEFTRSRDYYPYYSGATSSSSQFDRLDLELDKSGNNYTVKLAHLVSPSKQGALLLEFTTDDFVSEGLFGKYNYEVRTLLSTNTIDESSVKLTFDKNIFSREGDQERDYEDAPDSTIELRNGPDYIGGLNRGMGASSSSADSDYYREDRRHTRAIKAGGSYSKSESNLIPGDTLMLKGEFATNKPILILKDILLFGGIAALIGIIIGVIAFRQIKKNKKRANEKKDDKDSQDPLRTYGNRSFSKWSNQNQQANANEPIEITPIELAKKIGLTSLVSNIATLTAVIVSLATLSQMGYQMAQALIIFLVFALVMGLLICPLLYIMRYGVRAAFLWSITHVPITFLMIITVLGTLLEFFSTR